RQRLQALHDFCQVRNITLMVVTFPFLHALGERYEYADVHQTINAFWHELSTPHLDLYDTFQSYDAEDVVIGKFDAHPNEQAHQLAASAMADFIARTLAEQSVSDERSAP
ncbi:MAG: hypothetical protein O3A51_05745, partial [Verrucomicrobia bacterium]|nr:hypothetical protein [Verrucomicrobiota bacterium]